MAEVRDIPIKFPTKGLVKRFGYSHQPPETTAYSLNIYPYEWETGRERGGVRPGIAAGYSIGSDPSAWCEATWRVSGGGSSRGVAVATKSGTYISTGAGYTGVIAGASGSDFMSCTVYGDWLVQGDLGALDIKVRNLYESESGDLTNGSDEDVFPGLTRAGTAPTNCALVQRWNDRLMVAADNDNPHALYASKMGNIIDWDFSDVSLSGAWSSTGSEGGQIGEPITALIPHNKDCLLIGCTDSLYVMRGNPRAGGHLYNLSEKIGPIQHSAWTKDGADTTWMLTRHGLWKMPPGCGQPPVSVSREILPDDLNGLDPTVSGSKFSLAYDERFRGLHIMVLTGSERIQYFYDLQNGGFWKQDLGFDMRLAAELKSIGVGDKSACQFMTGSSTYDFSLSNTSENIDSELWLGPFAIADQGTTGILASVQAVLGEDSGNVAWSLYVGDSPQEAFNGNRSYLGSNWTRKGLNHRQYPRTRGTVFFIKLEDVANSRWTVEEILARVSATGARRVSGE